MKLLNVKILGENFRSLSANKLYKFNHTSRENKLSAKIFAGLNGSGKSNFLELFSEIFYFLEICQLNTVLKSEKSTKAFGFEIEYLLPMSSNGLRDILTEKINEIVEEYIRNNLPLTKYNRKQFENIYIKEIKQLRSSEIEKASNQFLKDNYAHVRIVKLLGSSPEYSIKRQDDTIATLELKEHTKNVLPTKIIAYTSGQNELLSNPYHKLKYHYFKSYEERSKIDNDIELINNHRLFFLDYSTNFSIFIANILLADKKKEGLLKEVLKIHDLQSFRITINSDELNKKVLSINQNLSNSIHKLKLCSTTCIEKKVGEYNLIILDFLINDSIKDAFEFHFSNAFNLFKLFYELEIFNLYLVDKKIRDLMLQVHKSYNFSDEMPKPDPSRLVFRIEKIFISKKIDDMKPAKNIYYKALSDGEHQFNEVIGTILMMQQEGCLFLIDEPDTHFNPKWRAKLIEMINYMAAISFDNKGKIEKVRKQEIIITTHSPFVISDSSSLDVYRFKKINGVIEYDNPLIQMYGASISVILDEIFEKSETISEMAKTELKDMLNEISTIEQLREIVDKLNTSFGDSVEKFDLFSRIKSIKNEIEKNKN